MKNLVKLVSEGDVHDYIKDNLQSEPFRASYANPHGFVRTAVNRFAEKPRFLWDMSDPTLEYHGFSTFFGGITLRRCYPTPRKTDAYLLHEMTHITDWQYTSDRSSDDFFEAVWMNELVAGFTSRALVYFAIPGLYDLVKHEGKNPWIDDYFCDRKKLVPPMSNHELFWQDRQLFEKLLLAERLSSALNPQRASDTSIARDRVVSELVSRVWMDVAGEIETQMQGFYQTTENDRYAAADMHEAWLMDKRATTLCPFEEQIANLDEKLRIILDQPKRIVCHNA